MVDFILIEYTVQYRAYKEKLKKQNIQFRPNSAPKYDTLFFCVFLESCIKAQIIHKMDYIILTYIFKIFIKTKLNLSIQNSEKYINGFTKILVEKMKDFEPNSKGLIEILV